MARTGFFDKSQQIYLPKDTLTWDDLASAPYTGGWDSWTGWYQNLSGSTEVEFTTDIIDFGSSATVLPLATVFVARDGGGDPSLSTDYPTILIEGSDVSDLSSGVSSITLTKDTSPNYTSIGKHRYYRFTFTINSGTNSTPQGFTGFNINLDTTGITEVIENFDTSTVDDGSSVDRTISTRNTYSAIKYVGITPVSTITDTVVSGVSGGTALYVADGYVATGYTVGSVGTVSTSTITTVPLSQFVSSTTNSITVRLFKPNTGVEIDATVDILVRGLGSASIDSNGNLVRT